jgi:hypothetical protein
MQEVVWQEGDSIEIIVWGDLTVDEFKQAIHQLESLCTAHPKIKVLLDAGGLESTQAGIGIEEYDFYKKYKHHLERVAVVTDSRFQAFLTSLFNKFTDAEFRVFPNKKTDEARKWIFPSRLP